VGLKRRLRCLRDSSGTVCFVAFPGNAVDVCACLGKQGERFAEAQLRTKEECGWSESWRSHNFRETVSFLLHSLEMIVKLDQVGVISICDGRDFA
jgi:hypothetical protein